MHVPKLKNTRTAVASSLSVENFLLVKDKPLNLVNCPTWLLRTKLGSHGRAGNSINHCASLSLALSIINGEKNPVPFGILRLNYYLYLLDSSSVLVAIGNNKRYLSPITDNILWATKSLPLANIPLGDSGNIVNISLWIIIKKSLDTWILKQIE